MGKSPDNLIFPRSAQRLAKKYSKTKKSALALLVGAGIATKSGKLTKPYQSKKTQRPKKGGTE